MKSHLVDAHRNALSVVEATGEIWLFRDLADPVERRTPRSEPYRFEYHP
ncbi:hypothetical protein [Halorubrum sp. Atlit-8R]|nr:hypothetical protein [Halorubrum sp. Atlit-8R]